MKDKEIGTIIARGGLIAVLLFMALPGYIFLSLLMMGMPPYLQRIMPVLGGLLLVLLILFLAVGWIIARFSGTEPILRIFSEAADSKTALGYIDAFHAFLADELAE